MTDAPFFILASPRSGTTLLERLLNRHSRIFIPPETAFFYQLLLHGYLRRPYSAQQARKFIDYYLTTRPASLLGLARREGIDRKLLDNAQSYPEIFLNLVSTLSAGAGKPRLGEKTPHHLRCVDYLIDNFSGSRFVCMVRDGRAVVRSRVSHPLWERNWVGAAKIWREDMKALRALGASAEAHRVLTVRYEDLVAEPEPVLRRICDFLGESFEPGMLHDRQPSQAATESYAEYYRQAWMAKSTSAIDPARATDWVRDYGARELALVEHLLREELDALGYPPMARRDVPWRGLYASEWLRHGLYRARVRFSRLLPARRAGRGVGRGADRGTDDDTTGPASPDEA